MAAPLSADKSMNVDQYVALFAPVIRGQTAAISTFCGFTNFLCKQPKKDELRIFRTPSVVATKIFLKMCVLIFARIWTKLGLVACKN